MPAFGVHHTETDGGVWDSDAAERNVLREQDRDYYARIYAWYDPDGEVGNKSTYKFIHHRVNEDGRPGAASIVACRSGIGILNGARGGADIPDRDRAGVWRHLAAHIRDAGLEPPELKGYALEFKEFAFDEALTGELANGVLAGIAWRYDEPDAFGDVCVPGAFGDSIKQRPSVPLLWQHDPSDVIGSALLQDTGNELLITADLDLDDPVAQRAYRKVRKGLINGLSLGFVPQEAVYEEIDGMRHRVIKRADVWEVSLVTFPAHPSARVTVIKSAGAVARLREMLIKAWR